MKYPLSELVDKYSILALKRERLPDNQELNRQCDTFLFEISKYEWASRYIIELKGINGRIWDLEADIRKGKEKELTLEEVGRRALSIRDLNKERIFVKNRLAIELGEEFQEIKIDHASQN